LRDIKKEIKAAGALVINIWLNCRWLDNDRVERHVSDYQLSVQNWLLDSFNFRS